MKVILNNIIPFGRYAAINLFGVMFAKVKPNERTIRHESIHTKQMKELLYVPFYLWYVIEWFIKLFPNKFNSHNAYRSISFEREAYENEGYLDYLNVRKKYSWLKYL